MRRDAGLELVAEADDVGPGPGQLLAQPSLLDVDVVGHGVGAERGDEVRVAPEDELGSEPRQRCGLVSGGKGNDVGSAPTGELHGSRADAAGCARDDDALAAAYACPRQQILRG